MCFEFFESIYLVQKQPFFSTDSALSASLIFFFSPIPPSKLQGDLPFMVGDWCMKETTRMGLPHTASATPVW